MAKKYSTVYNAKNLTNNYETKTITDDEGNSIQIPTTSRIEEILSYDDSNEYKRALMFNGSQSLKFMETLARRRSRQLLSILNIGIFKNGEWSKELTDYFIENYWEKADVPYHLTLACDKSFMEGRSAITVLPFTRDNISVNVPTVVSIVKFQGNKLEGLTVSQSATKGSFNYEKLYTYENKLEIKEGAVIQDIGKVDEIKNPAKGTFANNIVSNGKDKFNIPKDLFPAVYIEEYPTLNRLGQSKLEHVGKLLDLYELLHIEKYLFIENNGNKIEADFDGSSQDKAIMVKNISNKMRKNYINLIGTDDDDELENLQFINADYTQLTDIDDAIDRLEQKIASRIGMTSPFQKSGTFNATQAEVDMTVDEPSSNASQKQDALKWSAIAKRVAYIMIAVARDTKLKDIEVKTEIMPTDYKLLSIVSDKAEQMIKLGIFSPEYINTVLTGTPTWQSKEIVDTNFKLLKERMPEQKQEEKPMGVDNGNKEK